MFAKFSINSGILWVEQDMHVAVEILKNLEIVDNFGEFLIFFYTLYIINYNIVFFWVHVFLICHFYGIIFHN